MVTVIGEPGRYVLAESLCRRCLKITQDSFGEAHLFCASALNNLGGLLDEQGDYPSAERLYRQALDINRRVLGNHHPNVVDVLNNVAKVCAATGQPLEALQGMDEAAAIEERTLGPISSLASESHRAAYLERVRHNLSVCLTLVWREFPDTEKVVRGALDRVLKCKALGAEAVAIQRDTVLMSRHPALQSRLRELALLRTQITRKTFAGHTPESVKADTQVLMAWNAYKNRLEAELAAEVPEMNLETKLQAADRRAVALALPPEVVLVEFVRMDPFDFQALPARGQRQWQPARYVAFVLKSNQAEEVRLVDLGEAEPIDRLIADFRAAITGESEQGPSRDRVKVKTRPVPVEEDNPGRVLRETVFDRLAAAFSGRTRLLLAPDGDLTRLPFEVLPTDDGRRLIDDYSISYLACGRDVLRFPAPSTGQPTDALAAADPDFDLTIDGKAADPVPDAIPSHQSRDGD